MNFELNDNRRQLSEQVRAFMKEHIYPIEEEVNDFNQDPKNLWVVPPQIEGLKKLARDQGLWNLFLPHEYTEYSPGLTNLEYAPLAEEMGRVHWASEVFNCSAPDTGHLEVLARYGTVEQKKQWLQPLLNGEDLQKAGVPPGEKMGRILRDLENAQYEARIQDRAGALKWLQSQI